MSQRVDINEKYNERRDGLDQNWMDFLLRTGVIPILVPNNRLVVEHLLEAVAVDGILLTGGNTPVAYGGNATERDMVDTALLDYATQYAVPLIGVCRGMQSIAIYFGATLKKVEGHVGTRHKVNGENVRLVNSYHQLAIDRNTPVLDILSMSEDKEIEVVAHKHLPILGMMWHPEREQPFDRHDIRLFKEMWGRGGGV